MWCHLRVKKELLHLVPLVFLSGLNDSGWKSDIFVNLPPLKSIKWHKVSIAEVDETRVAIDIQASVIHSSQNNQLEILLENAGPYID